jgi:hypothetical protein
LARRRKPPEIVERLNNPLSMTSGEFEYATCLAGTLAMA